MKSLILLAGLLSAVQALADTGNTLVLVDTLATKDTHSIFFKQLTDRGYALTFKTADEPTLALMKYGEALYKNLIIFSPSVEEFGGSISPSAIASFIDEGGNVLVAASSNVGYAIQELAAEVGFELEEEGSAIIDKVNYDVSDDGSRTLVVVDPANLLDATPIVGDKKKINPILYRGIGIVSNQENPLILDLLAASTTAYSGNPEKKDTETADAAKKSPLLITSLQARNNARVVFTGSLDLFSDALFKSQVQKSTGAEKGKVSGNEALAVALSKWVFGEEGVLRVGKVEHHLVGARKSPDYYTIMEDVVYSIEIEERKNGQWVPYNANDVQLEFVRIDPFVRQTMKRDNSGRFLARFRIPDVYGVYKFVVDYKRVGYTHLYNVEQVSVHPLQHTQYERFIRSAYPYYFSAFSMMFSVFIFSCVFLYHKDSPKEKTK
ncbi:Dolichyl-diphosphooligosaccharide--protein glycosyltransferase 48 kDa subunit [Halotydeus destructor]|nr:Dolichyl-diphosphooligosaccharide--protein glycosyltransferase 48 kDa subunit [Halotydeus destructor]